MKTRRLGTDGPELSLIGLGCNNFGMKLDAGASAAVVGAALDAGVTHLDTAEGYGPSEEYIGAAIIVVLLVAVIEVIGSPGNRHQ